MHQRHTPLLTPGKGGREVPITCEQDIFEALGLDFVEAADREYGK
jgi:hypothetical protein